jgi:hypothetical protein
MSDALDQHYQTIIKAMLDGRLVPFFGAGVNLCDRPEGSAWQKGQYLPSGGELSEYLANNFAYPSPDKWDLVRVSEYIAVVNGTGPLYEELRKLFDADYPPTRLHQFFATFPALLRNKNLPPRYQLIVTTNYDDVMERALQQANEPYDVVTFVAEGDERGKFWHYPPDAPARLIDKPNEYRDVSLDKRTVILKIHGAIDRANPERDSYVITEDDYIDYLTRTDISNLVPVTLAAKLRKSNFLFLGYGLRDWNLRVILHRIWGEQKLSYSSWAVQLKPSPVDLKFWNKRDVEILDTRLDHYIDELAVRLNAVAPAGGNR